MSSQNTVTMAEMVAKRSRASVVRALETAVKRMEDKAQEARRELRHIEKMDLHDLTGLVGRLIALSTWGNANIVGDLTSAISDIAEQHHAAGVVEGVAEKS
jgi:hypothetical protein